MVPVFSHKSLFIVFIIYKVILEIFNICMHYLFSFYDNNFYLILSRVRQLITMLILIINEFCLNIIIY